LGKAIQYFKKYVKAKKLRLTKQRVAIINIFLANKGHICADEFYYLIRRKHPRIGRATVYRTLKLLKNAQIASEVDFTGRRKRFEHQFERPHHDHFICVGCGKVIEFIDPEIERKQDLLCRKYGFKGERHLMQIFGLCKDCKKGAS